MDNHREVVRWLRQHGHNSGADGFHSAYCDDAADIIEELTEDKNMNDAKKMEVMNRATDILLDIGIPANLKGFHYLRCGITNAYCDYAGAANRITKSLYPEIAQEFSTTSTRVERAIRHAVESAFNYNFERACKYLGRTPRAHSGKSTNSQFIMTLADRLLREDGICPKV